MSTVTPLRDIVRRIDPAAPLGTARTMEQVRNSAVAEPRFAAGVLGACAGPTALRYSCWYALQTRRVCCRHGALHAWRRWRRSGDKPV